MKDKISIIIPIYNVEKYLKQCLESVKNQSYINFEVIMVNDGSTDNSRRICEEYTKDTRFILINQKNQGISKARNQGMNYITGNYVMFVDSDDWLDLNCFEVCIKEIEKSKSEVVIFPYIKEYLFKRITKKLFETTKENYKEDILDRLFGNCKNPLDLENLNPVWGKLYKKEIISKISFIDMKEIWSEDLYFNIKAILKANKVSYIEKCFYHYRKNNMNSITKPYYKENLFFQLIKLYKELEKIIEKSEFVKEKKKYLNNRVVLGLFSLVINIVHSSLEVKNKKLELKKLLNEKIYKEAFKDFSFEFLPLPWKIFYFLCKTKNSTLLLIYTKIGLKLKGEK